jgi:hypothetical protein
MPGCSGADFGSSKPLHNKHNLKAGVDASVFGSGFIRVRIRIKHLRLKTDQYPDPGF